MVTLFIPKYPVLSRIVTVVPSIGDAGNVTVNGPAEVFAKIPALLTAVTFDEYVFHDGVSFVTNNVCNNVGYGIFYTAWETSCQP